VPSITTHAGFIPENLTDPLYPPLITALREAGTYCAERGISLWLETGQETPVVLLRVFEDVGLDNLGVNLDPANLGGLIDLMGNVALGDAKARSADVLGHVFEYFWVNLPWLKAKKAASFIPRAALWSCW